MNDTAYEIGQEFFSIYVKNSARILEVGSQNVNGTLRDFAPIDSEYVGIDIEPGPGVDLVLTDPYKFPFKAGRFDVVISSSYFEHDQMFWLTFLEMVRVTKPRGYIYINVPSNGNYHRHSVDAWRFYPDAVLALESWARRKGRTVKLIECFTTRQKQDIWNDCVMIFAKKKYARRDGDNLRLVDRFPDSFNVRYLRSRVVENLSEETEDRILLRQAVETVEAQRAQISSIAGERDQAAATVASTQEELAASTRSLAEMEQSNALLMAAAVECEAALRAEIALGADAEAALRMALYEAACETEHWGAKVKAREADMTAMRDASTKLHHRLEERAAAAEVLQKEREMLLGQLAEAERRLREGETANAAMRVEIASLNGQLAVAREVRGAVIAALRTEIAAAPEPMRNPAWRPQLPRLFGLRATLSLPSPGSSRSRHFLALKVIEGAARWKLLRSLCLSYVAGLALVSKK